MKHIHEGKSITEKHKDCTFKGATTGTEHEFSSFPSPTCFSSVAIPSYNPKNQPKQNPEQITLQGATILFIYPPQTKKETQQRKGERERELWEWERRGEERSVVNKVVGVEEK